MTRRNRLVRLMLVVCTAGVMPSFILRCDKAALNFQRSFMQSLGEDMAAYVFTLIGLNGAQAQ